MSWSIVGRMPMAATTRLSPPLPSLRAKLPRCRPVLCAMYQGTSSPRSTFILATSELLSAAELAFSTSDMRALPPLTGAESGPDVTVWPEAACTLFGIALVGKKLSSQQPPWSLPR